MGFFVNRDGTLRPRWVFVLGYLVFASQGRFMVLLVESLGLDQAEIGGVESVARFLNSFSPLVWGLLADRVLGLEMTMVVSTASAAIMFSLFWFPQFHNVYSVLLIRCSHTVLFAGAQTVMDSYCLAHVDVPIGTSRRNMAEERKKLYGRERAFGAVSRALGNFSLGAIFDYSGSYLYMVPFYVLSSIMFLLAFLANMMWRRSLGHSYKALAREEGSLQRTESGRGASMGQEGHGTSQFENLERASAMESLRSEYESDEDSSDEAETLALEAGQSRALVHHDTTSSTVTSVSTTVSDGTDTSVELANSNKDQGLNDDDDAGLLSNLSVGQKLAIFATIACCSLPNVIFFITLAVARAGIGLVQNLSFLFFRDEIGSSNMVMALSVCVTVIFEIPCFTWARSLLERFSASQLFYFALVAFSIRVTAYTFIPTHYSWLILLCEPLHGLTFALSQLSCVLIISDMAPRGLESFAQGTRMAVRSLGVSSGLIFGSLAIEEFGAPATYRGAALIVLVMGTIFACVFPKGRSGRSKECENVSEESED